ncbi:hypothetical protein ZWY2020_027103 [Hordeum vulgare]|nr:hypothetical protein ZWY2020_027103 [Hordeum vulgare]
MPAPAAPVVPRYNDLFEMDGVLGMSSRNYVATFIDIWVLHDYEGEVWTFKHKIELPITRTKVLCEAHDDVWDVVVVPGEGKLLVLVNEWLFQIDMDGKLVATFRCKEVVPTKFQLKQTLVPHTFFPKLEGYAVNNSPFI